MKKKMNALTFIMIFLTVAFLMSLFNLPCPFRFFFGIPCPGCGLSRALSAFIHLDLKLAFYYHPLFYLPIAIAIWLLIRYNKKWTTAETTLLIALMLLTVIVYIIRLILNHPLLSINLQEGLVYRILELMN